MRPSPHSLSYRGGQIIALLETLRDAARNLDDHGCTARVAHHLADSLEVATELVSGLLDDTEAALGEKAHEQPERAK